MTKPMVPIHLLLSYEYVTTTVALGASHSNRANFVRCQERIVFICLCFQWMACGWTACPCRLPAYRAANTGWNSRGWGLTAAPHLRNEPFVLITSCGGLTFTPPIHTASAKIRMSYTHIVIGDLLVYWEGDPVYKWKRKSDRKNRTSSACLGNPSSPFQSTRCFLAGWCFSSYWCWMLIRPFLVQPPELRCWTNPWTFSYTQL